MLAHLGAGSSDHWSVMEDFVAGAFFNFDIHDRLGGTTHYSWAKMISLALEGITSFTKMALRMVALALALITLVAIAIVMFCRGRAVRPVVMVCPIFCTN
jgi:hypothetical protein